MNTLTFTKPHNIRKLMRELYLSPTAFDKFDKVISKGQQIVVTMKEGFTPTDSANVAAIIDAHTDTPDVFLTNFDKVLKAQPIGASIVAEFAANNMTTQIPREQMATFASQFNIIQNLLMGGSLSLARDAVQSIPEEMIGASVKAYFLRRINDGIASL
jgi:hypothetical protein